MILKIFFVYISFVSDKTLRIPKFKIQGNLMGQLSPAQDRTCCVLWTQRNRDWGTYTWMLLEYHDYQCWSWGDAAPFCTTSYVHVFIMTPVGHPNSSNHPDVLAQTVRSIRDNTNTININVQQREWSRSTVVNSRWNEMQAVTSSLVPWSLD